MPAEVKALEPAPQRIDHDYALSYLVREGQGRVFVEVLGHDESIYKQTPMLAHILAGIAVRARRSRSGRHAVTGGSAGQK